MPEIEFKTGVVRPVECFKEGWQLIKDQYWLLFGISLLGGLIGGFSMYILLGAMICGIYFCFLQKIDGKTTSLDGLWVGFQKILPSFVVTLLIMIPLLAVYIIIYIPIIISAAMGSRINSGEMTRLFIGALAVDAVLIVVMTCLHALLLFSYPLIIDRHLGAWESITLSAKAVWRNLSGIVGMLGISFLAFIPITLLTCGIGVYFVLPIIFAGYAVAYRKVFPAADSLNFNPPPPNAFRNAGSYN